MSGRNRIYIDEVERLVDFLALGFALAPEDGRGAGIQESEILMDTRGITEDDLIPGTYIDMITR